MDTKKLFFWGSLVLLFSCAAAPCKAGMTIQNLSGPVTSTEISSFKTFMQGRSAPATNTYDNTLADGTAGMEAEALGLMYEVTNDPALLNQMIQYADQFLALRNDTNTGQIMWDGARDPVWLTKATNSSQAGYAGCENNDIVGHIAYCAKLILESPSLWNATIPAGDPHGYGATYYQRARTYITQMDFTQDAYMLKWFIKTNNFQIVAPTSSAWVAENENVNAYNRQMMFLNGFQRLSECHQILGDNPARVTEYDGIVKAAVNIFIGALQPYTTNSLPVYNWTYAPGSGGSEDNTLHSTYDVWGMTRAWTSGQYGISNSVMVPFANTLQQVMNVSTNHISYYVNGTSSPNSPRNFIYPGWMPIANFGPCTFQIMANMDIAQGSQASTAIYEALILWVKNARYLGVYPNNCGGPDFTVSTPWCQTVAAGSNLTCSVTVNPLAGFSGSVALSISGLPVGVTGNFNPASINGSDASTLTISAATSTPGGIHGLASAPVITGTSAGSTRAVPLTLIVKPQPLVTSASLSGTNLLISGVNGFPGATYYVMGSSNAASALSHWTPAATNAFDTNGHFNFTNQASPGAAQQFVFIRY